MPQADKEATENGEDLDLPTDAHDLANNSEIVNVRVARLLAEMTTESLAPQPVEKLRYKRTSSYAVGKGVFGGKFDFEFEFFEPSDERVARIEFSILVDHVITDEDFEPSNEAVDYFTSTTSYFAAYPYAREVLQSTTSRLGLAPHIMGLIRRDSLAKEFGVIEAYPPIKQ